MAKQTLWADRREKESGREGQRETDGEWGKTTRSQGVTGGVEGERERNERREQRAGKTGQSRSYELTKLIANKKRGRKQSRRVIGRGGGNMKGLSSERWRTGEKKGKRRGKVRPRRWRKKKPLISKNRSLTSIGGEKGSSYLHISLDL